MSRLVLLFLLLTLNMYCRQGLMLCKYFPLWLFLLFHNLALCITTLLTITSIWSSVNNTLPKVNYVKAIDVFLLTSFFCVVFTLLEYTIVLNCATILTVFKKTWKRRPPRKVKSTNNRHWDGILSSIIPYVMLCAIWYHLYNLKNVKNIHGGVLLLVNFYLQLY